MTTKLLALLTIAAIGLPFLKEPEFVAARNFSIDALGIKKSRVKADLYYFNPNGVALQLRKADLDVYVDNRFLGHTRLDTLIIIRRKDTFSLPVNMEVEMKNLFPNAFAMMTKKEFDLRIEGTAKLGKGGLFLNIPVRYHGKQKLTL